MYMQPASCSIHVDPLSEESGLRMLQWLHTPAGDREAIRDILFGGLVHLDGLLENL